MGSFIFARWIYLLTAVSLVASGCSKSGPDSAEVSGVVRLDGQLIEEGSIQFIPVDGTTGASSGGVIKNGKYHIDRKGGVTVGKNRVELRAFKESSKLIQDPTAKQGVLTKMRVPAFPPEYNDESTLVREITAGSNTINFDVQTESAK